MAVVSLVGLALCSRGSQGRRSHRSRPSLNGLVTGSYLALGAAGISFVYGILRLVNFAQGDFLTFGAYMALLLNVTAPRDIVIAALFAW